MVSALGVYMEHNQQNSSNTDVSSSLGSLPRRRLSMIGDTIPNYMDGLMKDLRERKKLFDETPPEEVKYWFEYTGPLQVSVGIGAISMPFLLFVFQILTVGFWIVEILLPVQQVSRQG